MLDDRLSVGWSSGLVMVGLFRGASAQVRGSLLTRCYSSGVLVEVVVVDESRQCRGTSKRSGERCKRRAIPGGRVCVFHGGAAPAVRAAAERRRAEAAARVLIDSIWDPDAPPVTDPVAALQALAGRLQHAVDVLGAHVDADALALEGGVAVAWGRVLRELRMALVEMERLGLAERHLELTEQAGEQLAGVLRAVFERLELNERQQELVAVVVPEELRRLASGLVVVSGPEVVRGELG